jgi:hypothetical protein
MENGAKKQELFNCLLFQFFTFSHFSYFKNAFFHIFFPNAFSKRIFSHRFHIFTKNEKNVKKCVLKMHAFGKKYEKMRFENARGKKCERM